MPAPASAGHCSASAPGVAREPQFRSQKIAITPMQPSEMQIRIQLDGIALVLVLDLSQRATHLHLPRRPRPGSAFEMSPLVWSDW